MYFTASIIKYYSVQDLEFWTHRSQHILVSQPFISHSWVNGLTALMYQHTSAQSASSPQLNQASIQAQPPGPVGFQVPQPQALTWGLFDRDKDQYYSYKTKTSIILAQQDESKINRRHHQISRYLETKTVCRRDEINIWILVKSNCEMFQFSIGINNFCNYISRCKLPYWTVLLQTN